MGTETKVDRCLPTPQRKQHFTAPQLRVLFRAFITCDREDHPERASMSNHNAIARAR
jgi:hypothetical protein